MNMFDEFVDRIRIRGVELRDGDHVTRRDNNGRIVDTEILEKRVPVFSDGSSGRACNGVHFKVDQRIVCYDKCAWQEVVRQK